MQQRGLPLLIKRGVDVAASLTGLVVSAPLIGAVAAAVRFGVGGPVLFRQPRSGRDGRPFDVFKFRTMTDERDARGELLPDARRLTSTGKLLRQYSLDELPQLWNVLRGDMSLVGPRPLMHKYFQRYSPVQKRRLAVLPGITGWCQIHGRNSLSWEEKFELDVWYVDHWSLALDARILILTFRAVLQSSGVTHGGHVTMPEFLGSAPQPAASNAR